MYSLNGVTGDRAGILLAPAPDLVQAIAEDGGEGVDVLVPGAVEVEKKSR
jgi:hypothetical protein